MTCGIEGGDLKGQPSRQVPFSVLLMVVACVETEVLSAWVLECL